MQIAETPTRSTAKQDFLLPMISLMIGKHAMPITHPTANMDCIVDLISYF